MLIRKWGMKATLLAACMASGIAMAQARTTPYPGLDISRFDYNAGGEDSLITATGKLSEVGKLRVSLLASYLSSPSVTRLGGDSVSARLGDRVEGQALLSYVLHERIQLTAQLPVVLFQNEGDVLASRGFAPVASNGVGSPLLGLRVGVLRQSDEMPVNLALGISGGLPFGDSAAMSRDPQPRFVPSLSLGRDFGDFTLGGQVYARLRSQENFQYRGVSGDVNDTVTHEAGAALSLSSEVAQDLRAELGVVTDFALKNGGATVQPFLGARYNLGGAELYAGGGPAFGSLVGTPDFRLLAGIAFGAGGTSMAAAAPAVVENPDIDGDGLANEVDRCVRAAEDVDGFQDEDGCPDPDDDADGIADAKDICPRQAGLPERGGCPIPDADGDALADEIDLCPNEKGQREDQGCPPKDTDQDGIVDRSDACLAEPGVAEFRGCPPPDQDKDGVADADDNCVREAGAKDNRGCPSKQKQLVVITKEQLQILDKVYFMPGRSTIVPRSRVLLDQVAKIIKEHEEIAKLRVEGHTDNVGKATTNQKLSEARAKAVLNYLVKKGVKQERVEAAGFGQDKPIAENTTDEGRESNRRVDFVIVGADTK